VNSVALADFNGDGVLDAAVGTSGDALHPPAIALLIGRGNGLFDPPRMIPLSGYSVVVRAADVNKDSKIDLVVGGLGASGEDIGVLLGNGDATFQDPIVTLQNSFINDFVLADLNNDGDLDVMLISSVSGSLGLKLALGNGNGTFGTPNQISPATGSFQHLDVADLDADGNRDILVSSFDSIGMYVLLGKGDGTFGTALSYGFGGFGLATADFDGDGKIDVALATSTSEVFVFLGNGDGTLRTLGIFPNPSSWGIAAADLNHDDRADIVTGSNLCVFLWNGTTFAPAVQYEAGAGGYATPVIADLTADGNPDVILGDTNALEVLRGHGDGTFFDTPSFSGPSGKSATADFNHDGNPDIVSVDGAVFAIRFGLASGGFGPAHTFDLAGGYDVVTGDFNGDADEDFAVSLNSDSAPAAIYVRLGNGDGTFRPGTFYAGGLQSLSLTAADLNADGRIDLAFIAYQLGGNSAVGVLIANANGTFPTPAYYAAGQYVQVVNSGDFNNDGNLDLVVGADNPYAVLPGIGDGTFGPPIYGFGYILEMATGDFNGDGKLDLAAVSSPNYNAVILPGNGDLTFGPRVDLGLQLSADVRAADLNGDGVTDLLIEQPTAIVALAGNGDGTFTGNQTFFGIAPPGRDVGYLVTFEPGMAIIDVNHDGKPDVVTSFPGGMSVLVNRTE
jgi:hypothetical protein